MTTLAVACRSCRSDESVCGGRANSRKCEDTQGHDPANVAGNISSDVFFPTRATLAKEKLEKLNCLLAAVWRKNQFYTHKWERNGWEGRPLQSLNEIRSLPLTSRIEFVSDQWNFPVFGTNLTFDLGRYKRIHRSAGTSQTVVHWGDDEESWGSILRCSEHLYELAGVGSGDRIFLAMRLGASSNASIMYEGALMLGGELHAPESPDPLLMLQSLQNFLPTVLVGKPRRLLELASLARRLDSNLADLGIEKIISAGAAGAAVPETRQALEAAYDAEIFDLYGLTEAGSVACECPCHPGGMHILENEFIAEVIEPDTDMPLESVGPGELVLTTLGRIGHPAIRYRTGDLVTLVPDHLCACGRHTSMLLGGVSRRFPLRTENSLMDNEEPPC